VIYFAWYFVNSLEFKNGKQLMKRNTRIIVLKLKIKMSRCCIILNNLLRNFSTPLSITCAFGLVDQMLWTRVWYLVSTWSTGDPRDRSFAPTWRLPRAQNNFPHAILRTDWLQDYNKRARELNSILTKIASTHHQLTYILETDRYLSKYLAWEWPAIKTGIELFLIQRIQVTCTCFHYYW
jgi:hypothetical protein